MDTMTRNSPAQQTSRSTASATGAKWGLLYGSLGAIATALVCAGAVGVGVALYGSAEGDLNPITGGIMLAAIVAVYGVVVGGMLGAVFGTVCGALLGAARWEGGAPLLAATLCSIVPVIATIAVALLPETSGSAAVLTLLVVPLAAAIGFFVGTQFEDKCDGERGRTAAI